MPNSYGMVARLQDPILDGPLEFYKPAYHDHRLAAESARVLLHLAQIMRQLRIGSLDPGVNKVAVATMLSAAMWRTVQEEVVGFSRRIQMSDIAGRILLLAPRMLTNDPWDLMFAPLAEQYDLRTAWTMRLSEAVVKNNQGEFRQPIPPDGKPLHQLFEAYTTTANTKAAIDYVIDINFGEEGHGDALTSLVYRSAENGEECDAMIRTW